MLGSGVESLQFGFAGLQVCVSSHATIRKRSLLRVFKGVGSSGMRSALHPQWHKRVTVEESFIMPRSHTLSSPRRACNWEFLHIFELLSGGMCFGHGEKSRKEAWKQGSALFLVSLTSVKRFKFWLNPHSSDIAVSPPHWQAESNSQKQFKNSSSRPPCGKSRFLQISRGLGNTSWTFVYTV